MDTAAIVKALQQTGKRALAAFDWDARTLKRSYARGKWTGKQLLGHLADCEGVFLVRAQYMLAEPTPPIAPFDQDAWAARFDYGRASVGELRGRFAALRASLVALAKSCSPADLQRLGNRPGRTDYSVGWLLEHAAEHTAHHLGQLAAIRAGKPWTPPA
jgi:uncharacterized damage-inducible protein DinB